jgi:hypothetical protein
MGGYVLTKQAFYKKGSPVEKVGAKQWKAQHSALPPSVKTLVRQHGGFYRFPDGRVDVILDNELM